jgi:hypothetical protein
MTTSGFAEVDDQLERRPVAILQTLPMKMGGFRRNPLGGVQIPLLPPFTINEHLDEAVMIA